jgi:nicotinamide phosphoribosyltransferase
MQNRIMFADSYKLSHPNGMYPKGTTYMFDYMESRGGLYPVTVFVGLQGMLKTYFSTPITSSEVEEANEWAKEHGEPFPYENWMYIVEKYNGNVPIKIRAVKEGTVVSVGNALVTIETSVEDEKVFWVVSWMETFFMKLWYPINIATRSFMVKRMLKAFSDETGSGNVDFQYHNFGDRGSTSVESASIGGMAHLTQFMGTDNFGSLKYTYENYFERMVGFSIPASEHSTVTSWGREKEYDMIENYVETYKGSAIIACVMDSYDIFKSVNFITSGKMKEKIESDEYPIFVIRPDSGNPVEVIGAIINIMEDNSVAFDVNEKGYKVWRKYRIIWGDGINMDTIKEILEYVTERGYSSDNIAFGSGGWLMQQHDRDTQKFAIKCSAIKVDGEIREVFKDPITDHGKRSKKGIISLYKTKDGFFTAQRNSPWEDDVREALETVFVDGKIIRTQTMSEIREISNKYL